MRKHFGRLLSTRIASPNQPIVAWRSWKLTTERVCTGQTPWAWWRFKGSRPVVQEYPALRSTWADRVWKPGVPVVARCGNCHQVLGKNCDCGIWASKTVTNLMEHGAFIVYPHGVFGQVALFGAMWEYEGGFRASAGMPLRLWLSNPLGARLAEQLAQRYKIPVTTDAPDELTALIDRTPAPEPQEVAQKV